MAIASFSVGSKASALGEAQGGGGSEQLHGAVLSKWCGRYISFGGISINPAFPSPCFFSDSIKCH